MQNWGVPVVGRLYSEPAVAELAKRCALIARRIDELSRLMTLRFLNQKTKKANMETA
jgi:hypothetical protein